MDIVLRATVMFAVVFILFRLLGKRELGEMTPFDLVTMIVVGDLIQQGITHNDFSLTGATLAISTFAFWSLVLGWAGFLFPPARKLLEGEARILVRDGEIIPGALRRDLLSRDDLESEMRLAGIAHIEEVKLGVLEPAGKISFVRFEHDDRSDQSLERPG